MLPPPCLPSPLGVRGWLSLRLGGGVRGTEVTLELGACCGPSFLSAPRFKGPQVLCSGPSDPIFLRVGLLGPLGLSG